jgi:hypothetical protein
VGGTLPKAVLLLLCFFSPALVACSAEPPGEPDRAETRNAARGTLAGGAGDLTVSGESPRKLAIEGARLQTGVEGEEIIVMVGHGGYFPDCVLIEARAVRGDEREGVSGRRTESRWPKDSATETAQMHGSYLAVFHEDHHPGGKVAEPRKTPYSVLCVEASTMRTVEAHVEGTPKASP